ncbi:MAG: tRNA 2-thiouridine(34) synthase MnmA [Bacteroidota bacterium]|nr:tRNA 2-thiouridine(34) synthase MnmA [Bacteroidota bacterium]MDP4232538.1 tRNA 2-thiouridine(34) synthase MnmA [Bacteroidota bacterium]MDP4241673.1 tRNA 2-thiouridine(34) synthase MnmA [Bacteroidota bacterium]MDP4286418.1 tRNA 2-thiouridine(34) synthase MnmA [Bacteroidota bacterium]
MARVLLGMSGGVDSSVAAALLREEGHDVIGMTIKTYNYEDIGGNLNNDTSCCSLDGINDARRVAARLKIPHYVTDMTEEFGREIIQYFTETYLAGETPNPCVKCNREIKWAAMLRKADQLSCEYIATGHYAHLRNEDGRMILSKSADTTKDQTYALWSVREEHLHRTLFPLQKYTKAEARLVAEKYQLSVAKKHESYEICFVQDNDYRRFLKDRVSAAKIIAPRAGAFVLKGETVGQHDGLPFYTIGQRKGLGLSIPSHPAPLYVTGLDVLNNHVHLGDDDDLLSSQLVAHHLNLIKYDALPSAGLRVTAKIRYKDEGALATAIPVAGDRMRVIFDEPRRAITPGQSVALYEGDDLIGGGIIEKSELI